MRVYYDADGGAVVSTTIGDEVQQLVDRLLPAETQILENEAKKQRVQLQQADELDMARCVEITDLHTQLDFAQHNTNVLQIERNTALSKVTDLERQICDFLFVDSDHILLQQNSAKTITDLHARIDKLQIRLSNCAHWSNPKIWVTTQGAMELIHQEASDAS